MTYTSFQPGDWHRALYSFNTVLFQQRQLLFILCTFCHQQDSQLNCACIGWWHGAFDKISFYQHTSIRQHF